MQRKSDVPRIVKILALGLAFGCVAITTLATPLTIGHVVVSSLPPLIILVIAINPRQAKPLAPLSGSLVSAMWAGAGGYLDASLGVAILFGLSFAVIGYFAGELVEVRRRKLRGR